MYISKIEIDNFRIYKHKNILQFDPQKRKNVFVVSGNNGYGKTTFLTTLVWCLYGNQMKDVDEIYKRQINEVGGYAKFLTSCMNRLASIEEETDFSVSITLKDINIPSLPCNEIQIIRRGNQAGKDSLEILIDGHANELTKEVGNEIFIQDYILPKEIAKFFFFDAEKIVYLAEIKSIAAKRQLSRAYSEVLGIKKYEDLRKNLLDLRLRFRKTSANPKDQEKFTLLNQEIKNIEEENIDIKIEIDKLEEEKAILKKESDELQEKLIREGSNLSVDEISNLKIEKYNLNKELDALKVDFKEILELAPFAIAGNLFSNVMEQVEAEKDLADSEQNAVATNKKISKLKREFKKKDLTSLYKLSKKADAALKAELEELIDKIFSSSKKKESGKSKLLHAFDNEDYNRFSELYSQLKSSYSSRVKMIAKTLREKRYKYAKVSRKLSDAESKETDGVIAKYRDEKVLKDARITEIERTLQSSHQKTGSLYNELNSKRKVQEELAKKIKVNTRYIEKDKLAEKLIQKLERFLTNIKKEKKESLQEKILSGLKSLMHKKSFVNRVEVEVESDIIDIKLYNKRKEEINKETLSKGEQQLYATAILRALVEESNIEFPVFIDSPLQKFDASHAKNIISHFYPKISKQVVLLPLLNKEMTKEEYKLLENKVKSAYIIHNEHEDQSIFIPVNPNNLFETAEKLMINVTL